MNNGVQQYLSFFIEKLAIPILLSIVVFLLGLLNEQARRRGELEKQLSESKYAVYERLIGSIHSALTNKLKSENGDLLEVFDFSEVFKKRPGMVVYASDKVLKRYNELHNCFYSAKGYSKEEIYKLTAELILSIRKDMGNARTKVTLKEVVVPIFTESTEICELSPAYGEMLNNL